MDADCYILEHASRNFNLMFNHAQLLPCGQSTLYVNPAAVVENYRAHTNRRATG